MAKATPTKATAAKATKKPTAKEQEYKALVAELSEIFDDISASEVKTLANMNQIEDSHERGSAIQYFWAAKKING